MDLLLVSLLKCAALFISIYCRDALLLGSAFFYVHLLTLNYTSPFKETIPFSLVLLMYLGM